MRYQRKYLFTKKKGEKDYTKVTVDEDFNITYLDKRTDLEKEKDYEGAEDDDELGDGGIILDEDKKHDPDASKIHDKVPTGWIGIYFDGRYTTNKCMDTTRQ